MVYRARRSRSAAAVRVPGLATQLRRAQDLPLQPRDRLRPKRPHRCPQEAEQANRRPPLRGRHLVLPGRRHRDATAGHLGDGDRALPGGILLRPARHGRRVLLAKGRRLGPQEVTTLAPTVLELTEFQATFLPAGRLDPAVGEQLWPSTASTSASSRRDSRPTTSGSSRHRVTWATSR